ncbi:MAG: peptidase G2 autoproteolytic cleavage domain-containing protein, partial [Bacteroidales bacterium]|nr:peptidase G2 autoproteolytic cleavage domain-containing protein [Bacteroidales bacterium]
MEEEKILIYNEENNYDTVVVEHTDEIIYDETIQVVEVDEQELFNVGTDSAFAALGAQNEQLNHALLHNRDAQDQHTIQSITGLRAELDGIHALKTVESDKRGYANYYEWRDAQNLLPGDRIGYFVSIHENDHKISICKSDEEIFGVVVDSAGFVGWQEYNEEDNPRDGNFALVANTGVVKVRCRERVIVGDYIMSNNDGIATRTENNQYGYYVISIDVTDNQRYAVISLDSAMNQLHKLSVDVTNVKTKVERLEESTNSAINAANEALKKSESNINSALQNSQNALDNANSALDKVTNLGNSLGTDVKLIKAQIDVIDESVVAASQKAALEAIDGLIDDAIDTNQKVNDLQQDIAGARETIEESLNEVRTLDNKMATISKYLSNDYIAIDTWGNAYGKTEGQIYYAKDTGLYHYYDAKTQQWLETPEPSEAGLSETIASIRQKADKDKALVENLASFSGEDYVEVETWNKYEEIDSWEQKKHLADPYMIYYDKSTQLYWQCDLNNLTEPW